MATVIAVMDRDAWDANTDVLVLADPALRRLTWIPRDLWCPEIRHRVNKAFVRGAFPQLFACLRAVGLEADQGICLRRSAVGRALEGVTVTVPVEEPLRLWYPLEPETLLRDGRKPVDFDPPSEVLSGERLHQWIGARQSRLGASSDLERLARQQVLVRALLEQGSTFSAAVADPDRVRLTGPRALAEAGAVTTDWTFSTFDRVEPARIAGMSVLVPRS